MQDNGDAISFERDIRPLFRDVDIDHMEAFGVQLADHAWMSEPDNAKRVYESLSSDAASRMPPGGPYWSDEQMKKLSDWMDGGYRP
ncbi:MAG TPA: hypothetical protein VKT51_06550 [Candidatus Eremiobacteraceae bacterium]|nr:hypothetical protein [Candidatus Eremiobacteraceae bacterium]